MAVVASAGKIPGFHFQPSLANLQDSADTYNSLVDNEELQAKVSPSQLLALAEIFVKFNVHKRLGIHLVHSHSRVATGNVMMRRTFTEPSGCWTTPVPMDEVDLSLVHGHIFKLVGGGHFVAYEYAEGIVTDLSDINSDFFKELLHYLQSHKLEEIIGLQILGETAGSMVEFDLGECGTVMLNAQDAHHGDPFRTTGWGFTAEDGVVSFQGQETHAPTQQGPHKVFINGKLAPDVPALKKILKQLGIID